MVFLHLPNDSHIERRRETGDDPNEDIKHIRNVNAA